MWDRVSKWKREHTGNWGKCVEGLFAASLFSTVPVELYRLCVSLQASLTRGLSGSGETFGEAAQRILSSLKDAGTWQEAAVSGVFGGISAVDSPILMIFLLILMGYAVIKVFFANLKGEASFSSRFLLEAFICSVSRGDIQMDLSAGASRW